MAVETQKLSELTGLRHEQTIEGEWTDVGEYMGCCDCGLVHEIEYRLRLNGKTVVLPKGTKIQERSFRDLEQTKLARESQNFVCGLGGQRR